MSKKIIIDGTEYSAKIGMSTMVEWFEKKGLKLGTFVSGNFMETISLKDMFDLLLTGIQISERRAGRECKLTLDDLLIYADDNPNFLQDSLEAFSGNLPQAGDIEPLPDNDSSKANKKLSKEASQAEKK